MKFIEIFECGHEEASQVGADPKPEIVTQSFGDCFWCKTRAQEREAARDAIASGRG